MGKGLVVVTGGCGFIGSHLTRALHAQGRTVRVLDDLSNGDPAALPPGVELLIGDVGNQEFVRAALSGAAAVFHLAAIASVAQSNKAWLASHATNSGGAVAVMEAIRDTAPEAAFIYASSAAVYGNVSLADGERIGESHPTVPLGPYGVDKLNMELHARVAGPLFGLRTFGLRFFNVFGPGQAPDSPYSGVISRFVAAAIAGKPITIHGDGEQTRDFVYIDDVTRAMVLAEERASAAGPIANICTGVPTSINELATIITRRVDRAPAIGHSEPRAGDIRRSVGDPTLAGRLLGWQAAISLSDGIDRLMEADEAVSGPAARRA